MHELYKIHRPRKLTDVVGQDHVVKSVTKMIKNKTVPHSLLFTGPSGCGKTTIARILARHVGCSKYDFKEINCADFRGIDMVRNIRSRLNQAPLQGKSTVYLIDECHKLSNDAQNALLKPLEDTPAHVYFFLATTDPQKLIKTIRTRCTDIALKSIPEADLKTLLTNTCKQEKKRIGPKVISKIVENSENSARKALVFLQQVIGMDNEADMINAILSDSIKEQSITIARGLMNPRMSWTQMSKILKNSDLTDAEGLRWLIMSYAKSVMLSGGKLTPRAYLVIDAFRDHFYDSKANGLVAACYEVICEN